MTNCDAYTRRCAIKKPRNYEGTQRPTLPELSLKTFSALGNFVNEDKD